MPTNTLLVSYSSIAGAEIRYARHATRPPPHPPYGTKGKGPRTVRSVPLLQTTLHAALEELWTVSGLGPAEVLVSAGFYVNRPEKFDRTGRLIMDRHREGQAVDIDAIWWTGRNPLITLNASIDAKRYLGTEAILHQHFGTTLGYFYNRAHRDHWHCDIGKRPGWRGTYGQVAFLQACLVHIFGYQIAIDGKLGPKTKLALSRAMLPSVEAPITARSSDEEPIFPGAWGHFLKFAAQVGWRDQ